MVCLARQVGTQWTSDGHQPTKRRAFIAHAVFTECPKVERFLGTPCRSAALLLCIMPHDDFVILRWRFYDTSIRLMILLSDLWYFYDTSCKIIQNVSFLYLIIYQLFISTFCQKMILWYFFHKKLFTYEHILNGKSQKYLIWNLIDTSFASFAPHALNQWSPARSGIENRWPKGKAKVKGRSS